MTVSRARIVRVRTIQHRLAQRAAASAHAEVARIEAGCSRLDDLSAAVAPVCGPTDGAALASRAEIVARLTEAATDLTTKAVHRRAVAVLLDDERRAADVRQSGAEQMLRTAERDAARAREAAVARQPTSRRRALTGGVA